MRPLAVLKITVIITDLCISVSPVFQRDDHDRWDDQRQLHTFLNVTAERDDLLPTPAI